MLECALPHSTAAMLALYPQIKLLHIWLIALSGGLFALRGLCAQLGMDWPRWAAIKWTSVVIDSLLLTAAAMLYTILPRGLFANGWLTLKLVLVLVYIVLGILAMQPHRARWQGWLFYLAALTTFGWIIGIARMHTPWGWLAPWML